MLTHEVFTKNEDGNWEHESYISAFELANDACTYDDAASDMTPQDMLDILERTNTVFLYEGEDQIKAVRLSEPLVKNQYGELRTISETQEEDEQFADLDTLYNGLNQERWESAERNSRVNW